MEDQDYEGANEYSLPKSDLVQDARELASDQGPQEPNKHSLLDFGMQNDFANLKARDPQIIDKGYNQLVQPADPAKQNTNFSQKSPLQQPNIPLQPGQQTMFKYEQIQKMSTMHWNQKQSSKVIQIGLPGNTEQQKPEIQQLQIQSPWGTSKTKIESQKTLTLQEIQELSNIQANKLNKNSKRQISAASPVASPKPQLSEESFQANTLKAKQRAQQKFESNILIWPAVQCVSRPTIETTKKQSMPAQIDSAGEGRLSQDQVTSVIIPALPQANLNQKISFEEYKRLNPQDLVEEAVQIRRPQTEADQLIYQLNGINIEEVTKIPDGHYEQIRRVPGPKGKEIPKRKDISKSEILKLQQERIEKLRKETNEFPDSGQTYSGDGLARTHHRHRSHHRGTHGHEHHRRGPRGSIAPSKGNQNLKITLFADSPEPDPVEKVNPQPIAKSMISIDLPQFQHSKSNFMENPQPQFSVDSQGFQPQTNKRANQIISLHERSQPRAVEKNTIIQLSNFAKSNLPHESPDLAMSEIDSQIGANPVGNHLKISLKLQDQAREPSGSASSRQIQVIDRRSMGGGAFNSVSPNRPSQFQRQQEQSKNDHFKIDLNRLDEEQQKPIWQPNEKSLASPKAKVMLDLDGDSSELSILFDKQAEASTKFKINLHSEEKQQLIHKKGKEQGQFTISMEGPRESDRKAEIRIPLASQQAKPKEAAQFKIDLSNKAKPIGATERINERRVSIMLTQQQQSKVTILEEPPAKLGHRLDLMSRKDCSLKNERESEVPKQPPKSIPGQFKIDMMLCEPQQDKKESTRIIIGQDQVKKQVIKIKPSEAKINIQPDPKAFRISVPVQQEPVDKIPQRRDQNIQQSKQVNHERQNQAVQQPMDSNYLHNLELVHSYKGSLEDKLSLAGEVDDECAYVQSDRFSSTQAQFHYNPTGLDDDEETPLNVENHVKNQPTNQALNVIQETLKKDPIQNYKQIEQVIKTNLKQESERKPEVRQNMQLIKIPNQPEPKPAPKHRGNDDKIMKELIQKTVAKQEAVQIETVSAQAQPQDMLKRQQQQAKQEKPGKLVFSLGKPEESKKPLLISLKPDQAHESLIDKSEASVKLPINEPLPNQVLERVSQSTKKPNILHSSGDQSKNQFKVSLNFDQHPQEVIQPQKRTHSRIDVGSQNNSAMYQSSNYYPQEPKNEKKEGSHVVSLNQVKSSLKQQERKPSELIEKKIAESLQDFAIPTTINNSRKPINRRRIDKPDELEADNASSQFDRKLQQKIQGGNYYQQLQQLQYPQEQKTQQPEDKFQISIKPEMLRPETKKEAEGSHKIEISSQSQKQEASQFEFSLQNYEQDRLRKQQHKEQREYNEPDQAKYQEKHFSGSQNYDLSMNQDIYGGQTMDSYTLNQHFRKKIEDALRKGNFLDNIPMNIAPNQQDRGQSMDPSSMPSTRVEFKQSDQNSQKQRGQSHYIQETLDGKPEGAKKLDKQRQEGMQFMKDQGRTGVKQKKKEANQNCIIKLYSNDVILNFNMPDMTKQGMNQHSMFHPQQYMQPQQNFHQPQPYKQYISEKQQKYEPSMASMGMNMNNQSFPLEPTSLHQGSSHNHLAQSINEKHLTKIEEQSKADNQNNFQMLIEQSMQEYDIDQLSNLAQANEETLKGENLGINDNRLLTSEIPNNHPQQVYQTTQINTTKIHMQQNMQQIPDVINWQEAQSFNQPQDMSNDQLIVQYNMMNNQQQFDFSNPYFAQQFSEAQFSQTGKPIEETRQPADMMSKLQEFKLEPSKPSEQLQITQPAIPDQFKLKIPEANDPQVEKQPKKKRVRQKKENADDESFHINEHPDGSAKKRQRRKTKEPAQRKPRKSKQEQKTKDKLQLSINPLQPEQAPERTQANLEPAHDKPHTLDSNDNLIIQNILTQWPDMKEAQQDTVVNMAGVSPPQLAPNLQSMQLQNQIQQQINQREQRKYSQIVKEQLKSQVNEISLSKLDSMDIQPEASQSIKENSISEGGFSLQQMKQFQHQEKQSMVQDAQMPSSMFSVKKIDRHAPMGKSINPFHNQKDDELQYHPQGVEAQRQELKKKIRPAKEPQVIRPDAGAHDKQGKLVIGLDQAQPFKISLGDSTLQKRPAPEQKLQEESSYQKRMKLAEPPREKLKFSVNFGQAQKEPQADPQRSMLSSYMPDYFESFSPNTHIINNRPVEQQLNDAYPKIEGAKFRIPNQVQKEIQPKIDKPMTINIGAEGELMDNFNEPFQKQFQIQLNQAIGPPMNKREKKLFDKQDGQLNSDYNEPSLSVGSNFSTDLKKKKQNKRKAPRGKKASRGQNIDLQEGGKIPSGEMSSNILMKNDAKKEEVPRPTRSKSGKRDSFINAGLQMTQSKSILQGDLSVQQLMQALGASDQYQLVPCDMYKNFDLQPYQIYFTFEVQMLMLIHSYLSKNEVIGLLGGKIYESNVLIKNSEQQNQRVKMIIINRIYPSESCIDNPKNRQQNCELSTEEQIRISTQMENDGVQKVAWYHSHPIFEVDPSIVDVSTHYSQQVQFDQSGLPFFGVIVGPYNPKQEFNQTLFNVFNMKDERTMTKQALRPENFKDRLKSYQHKIIPRTKLNYQMYDEIKKMIKHSSMHKYDRPSLNQQWSNRRLKQNITCQDKFMNSLKAICLSNLKLQSEFSIEVQIKRRLLDEADRQIIETQLAKSDLTPQYHEGMARPQDASVDTATMAGETPGRLSLTGPETGKQMMHKKIFSISDEKKIDKFLFKIQTQLKKMFDLTPEMQRPMQQESRPIEMAEQQFMYSKVQKQPQMQPQPPLQIQIPPQIISKADYIPQQNTSIVPQSRPSGQFSLINLGGQLSNQFDEPARQEYQFDLRQPQEYSDFHSKKPREFGSRDPSFQ